MDPINGELKNVGITIPDIPISGRAGVAAAWAWTRAGRRADRLYHALKF